MLRPRSILRSEFKLRCFVSILVALAFTPLAAIAAIPARQQINVTGYVIKADLDPATGRLNATATVTFATLEDLTSVVFGLNNGLQITSLTSADKSTLTPERNAADSTVRVGLAAPLTKGTNSTWTFTYGGTPTVDTSPVDGINFLHVADPVSILLYPGRWFPIPLPGLYTDRFTAEIHVTVPAGERAIGSGIAGQHTAPGGKTEFVFNWTKPGFPGTIIAGKFLPPVSAPDAPNIHVFLTDANKAKAHDFAETVAKQFEYMTSQFGGAESPLINVVELPSDSVSASWAPEIVAIRPDRGTTRLLANTVAHQWWGSEVSPATLNDQWITNGMTRYAELMYIEDQSGKIAMQSAITDTEAAALAYDTEPLTSLSRVDPFSPQFQNMTYDKGAMVFHMLRWEMGDEVFTNFLRAVLSQNIDKSIRTSQVQTIAEAQSHLQLTPFFSQWVDGTGAPQFGNNYQVYRLGSGKGFRTVGTVTQDLDLFKMPVELRIETEGKTDQTPRRSLRHRVRLQRRNLRPSAQDHHRPRQLAAQEHPRPRRPRRRAARPAGRRAGRPPRRHRRIPESPRRRPRQLTRQLPPRRSLPHAEELPGRR